MKKLGTWLPWLGGVLVLLGILLIILRKKNSLSEQFSQAVQNFKAELRPLITAIAKHETGNFTSRIAKENNNFFGMKHPKIRNTYSKGADQSGYAIFERPVDSVNDLILWFQYNRIELTGNPEIDIRAMKDKGYFEDSYENYLNGVKRWL